jgi:putative ABC transport system substrate-binding protein
MKRRAFLVAAAFASITAIAQPAPKVATIGLVVPMSAPSYAQNLAAFRQGLRERGYIEGRNLRLEVRYAEGKLERIASLAEQLAAMPVDVLVTVGSHVTRVTRTATRDIPIVMAYAGDPVGGRLVASLSRPGGRITGLTTISPQLAAKRLELLKEALPKLESVAVIWNPAVPERVLQFKETEDAARTLGIGLHSFEARTGNDIGAAVKGAAAKRIDALIILDDALLSSHQKRIFDLALEQRLPSLHQRPDAAELGGLLAYGPSFRDLHHRAAGYVDRILKGAKPGELPVEQPAKFELVVNLKTAKALGVRIAPSVLVRADRVIE